MAWSGRPRPPRPRAAPAGETFDPYTIALRWLGRRELSRAQLRERLLVRTGDPAAVDTALDRLTASGALDDARVARAFARTAAVVKGRGRDRILRDLVAMGIAADVARAAVDDVCGTADEDHRLDHALERRSRGVDLTDPRVRRRIVAALLRQGFAAEAVSRALQRRGADPGGDAQDE